MTIEGDQIIWDIEEQHLDEAEFLFEIREAALDAPHYTLADLAQKTERRLRANIDGLAYAGPMAAEELLTPVLRDPHASMERVAAAALARFVGDFGDPWGEVLAALDESDRADAQHDGVIAALRMRDDAELEARVVGSIQTHESAGVATRLEILADRNIPTGEWLLHMLGSADARVVRAAARLARHTVAVSVLDAVGRLADSSDARIREAVLSTALVRGLSGAWEVATYTGLRAPDESRLVRRAASTWIAQFGDASVVDALTADLNAEHSRADRIWALGFSGWPAAVDHCVALLEDPEVGRLAAEAICAITGLSRDEESAWRIKPARDDELPQLHQDNLNADLVPTAEDKLPWPDPGTIALWWASRRAGFHPQTRYLGGRPMDGSCVLDALTSGPLRRRHALAFELAVRSGGSAWLDTRAATARQRLQLGRLATVINEIDFQRGRPLPRP